MIDCRFTLVCFQTTSVFPVALDPSCYRSDVHCEANARRRIQNGTLRKARHFVYFHPSIRLLSAIKRVNWLSVSTEICRRFHRYNDNMSRRVICCLHRQDGNDASADIDSSVQNDASEGLDLGTNSEKRRRKEQLEEELFLASQRLRLRQDREVLRIRAHRPVWTYLIIVLNMSLVLLQKAHLLLLRTKWASLVTVPSLLSLGAKVSTKVVSGELWRLVTAAFLHVDVGHLLLNSYALFALGSATEILFGSAAFMAIYMGGAVGGNVFSVVASISSSRPSVGSSGGVFALIAAMCVHLERNRAAIGPIARNNLKVALMATVINLIGGWIMPSVDGWAHFGGFMYGVVMATCLVPTVVLHRGHDGRIRFVEVRRVGIWACWTVFIVAVVISVAVAAGVRISKL